jgi:hypothetical protein
VSRQASAPPGRRCEPGWKEPPEYTLLMLMPPRKAVCAVDDEQLAVVALVEQPLAPRGQRVDGVELQHVHAASARRVKKAAGVSGCPRCRGSG